MCVDNVMVIQNLHHIVSAFDCLIKELFNIIPECIVDVF